MSSDSNSDSELSWCWIPRGLVTAVPQSTFSGEEADGNDDGLHRPDGTHPAKQVRFKRKKRQHAMMKQRTRPVMVSGKSKSTYMPRIRKI